MGVAVRAGGRDWASVVIGLLGRPTGGGGGTDDFILRIPLPPGESVLSSHKTRIKNIYLSRAKRRSGSLCARLPRIEAGTADRQKFQICRYILIVNELIGSPKSVLHTALI